MTQNLMKVLNIARDYHRGQLYGSEPYEVHLIKVLSLAQEMNCDMQIQIACLLHDTLEDTHAEYKDLVYNVGKKVADIVEAVTDEDGATRKEKKRATYPKIRRNWKAVVVKILDRIANISTSIENQNLDLLAMYEKEHSEMFVAVFDSNHPKEVFEAWELYARYFNFNISKEYLYHLEMKSYKDSNNKLILPKN